MEARRDLLQAVWERALARCDGAALAREALAAPAARAAVGPGPRWVVALGKAAGPLAEGAVAALGRVDRVVVVAGGPEGVPPGAELSVGEHPVPGAGSFAAGQRLLQVAAEARAAGAAVVGLVGGGASALCEAPAEGLSPEDLAEAHRRLVAAGLPIHALNTVRRALSRLKGGGLATAFGPALRWVGVLADVPSGRPEEVGSGPLVPGRPDAAAALAVIRGADRLEGLPATVLRHLERAAAETPAGSEDASRPTVQVLATPRDLARAAADAADALGAGPLVLRPEPVTGIGIEGLVREIRRHLMHGQGLWIAAGEVDVPVPLDAPGKGGRAQHLAMEVLAGRVARPGGWAFLAGASDGRDGDGGGGAALDHQVHVRARDLARAQAAFDSGGLHAGLGTRLPGGPPRTNLTDLYLALAGL